jgi:hypothetical protein
MIDDPFAAPSASWAEAMSSVAEKLFEVTRNGPPLPPPPSPPQSPYTTAIPLCAHSLPHQHASGHAHLSALEMTKLRNAACQFALALAAAFVKRACGIRPSAQELLAGLSLVRKGCNVLGHR